MVNVCCLTDFFLKPTVFEIKPQIQFSDDFIPPQEMISIASRWFFDKVMRGMCVISRWYPNVDYEIKKVPFLHIFTLFNPIFLLNNIKKRDDHIYYR